MKHLSHKSNRRRGFTLIETVIAMGIITIMITAFMAAFGPAVQGIRKSLSAKEVNRLSTTLESELSILREGEGYSTAFEKAFTWIGDSFDSNRNNMVLLYQYRGDPNTTANSDGTLVAYNGGDGIPGKDYVLQSVVRRFDNPLVADELQPRKVEGRVFYVRMAQLVYDSGALVVTDNPTQIVDPHSAGGATSYTTYPEAVIAFQAQFYLMKSSIYSYVNAFDPGDTTSNSDATQRHPKSLGKPIFTRNMAVRR